MSEVLVLDLSVGELGRGSVGCWVVVLSTCDSVAVGSCRRDCGV